MPFVILSSSLTSTLDVDLVADYVMLFSLLVVTTLFLIFFSMSIVCAISNAIAKSVNHMCHIVVRNVGRCWSRQIVSRTLSMQCVSSKLATDNVNDCAFHFFLELCGGHVFRCCEHLCQRCVGVHMVK